MASSSGFVADEAETPMLVNAVDGAVNYKGHPASRSDSGGWRSAALIIGVEVAERSAYSGICSNLVTFLTGPLGQSTATAAANVNFWDGTASLLPLLGAIVADSFLGRYRTIAMASLLFLNKALLAPNHLKEDDCVCSIAEIEEAKGVLRLFPIWGTCLIYAIVFAQSLTFFTKQGATMERTIFTGFKIPAASLQSFIEIGILITILIYDRIFVPIARSFTRKPSGITMLQRIGTGIFISAFSMVIAALVEMKRLKTAQLYDLVDKPSETIPMSVWWLVPQYLLYGIADVFTMVGLQEFFYDQVPIEIRSIGLALYLSVFGAGSFLSSFLVSSIDRATSGDGQDSWFSDNLNRAHLDYFYWLLAGLSALGFAAYMHFARSYIYTRIGKI